MPAGIAQLGASVTLLGEQDLAAGDLRQYDAIVTGTRAYAVREDLKTYNRRLLDYVQQGGNLIVLYNTQEFVPDPYAPFRRSCPPARRRCRRRIRRCRFWRRISRLFNWPNTITKADFDGWVEQRGSKFFTEWDAAYTPMIATWDRGQAPQKGGWVIGAQEGGHLHLLRLRLPSPAAVWDPGAYRLLANLLALEIRSTCGAPPARR